MNIEDYSFLHKDESAVNYSLDDHKIINDFSGNQTLTFKKPHTSSGQ